MYPCPMCGAMTDNAGPPHTCVNWPERVEKLEKEVFRLRGLIANVMDFLNVPRGT